MEPSDAEATEKIAFKERIDVSTKLFIEYHASIRGYDTICAALSTAMLVIIPIVFTAISYIIKETPGEFRPIILIIFGLWTQLFSIAFIQIFLALLGERNSNYLRMQMSLAELAVFSDMPAIKGIQKTYELRGADHFKIVVDNDTKSEIDDSKKQIN